MARSLILKKVPTEILTAILGEECLSQDDLVSLRLTCKEMHAFATREYAKRYFRKIYIAMSRRSLRSLIGVCAHPVIGPYVRTIQFQAKRVLPLRAGILGEELDRAFDRGDTEDVEAAAHDLQTYIARCQEEHMLERTGEATGLLTQALSSLAAYGSPIRLTAISSNEDRAIGELRASVALNMIRTFDCECHMEATVKILITAATRAGCMLNALKIATKEFLTKGDDQEVDISINVVRSDATIFSSLEKFIVTLNDPPTQNTMQSIVKIMREAGRLQRLRLEMACYFDDERSVEVELVERGDTIMEAVAHLSQPLGLDNLRLRCIGCSQNQLISTLRRHKTFLRTLVLDHVALRRGAWGLVILWIRENLVHLEEIELEEFYKLDDCTIEDGDYPEATDTYDTSVHLEGREEIRIGLSKLDCIQ